MSQALSISQPDLLKEVDRGSSLEHLIFIWSPFGIGLTTFAIFVALMASYLVPAALLGIPLFGIENHHLVTLHDTRVAFAFSVLIATILGVQRYARKKDCDDAPDLARALRGNSAKGRDLPVVRPPTRRLLAATVLGLLVGFGVSLGVAQHAPLSNFYESPPAYFWFALANAVVCALFARGVVFSVAGSVQFRNTVDNDLQIDLLRIDGLSVIGRSAGRVAAIWFVSSAAACLLFIGGNLSPFIIVLLLACVAMGLWIFVAMMERVHRKIRDAKATELHSLRSQIDAARALIHGDPHAAVRLQGLLAYEARVAAAQEWPFDQTTLVRLVASAFILTVPWFGQAVAGYLVENADKLFH